MSVRCNKCGKHDLECGCQKYIPGPNDKFFYQGKFFEKEEDFWNYVNNFSNRQTTAEDFDRLFNMIKKDVWMNLSIRKTEISNSKMRNVLEDTFLFIMKNFW